MVKACVTPWRDLRNAVVQATLWARNLVMPAARGDRMKCGIRVRRRVKRKGTRVVKRGNADNF